jgi:erythronate-4-phosphate dehydrogenase
MKIVADANIPFVEECFSSIGEVETVAGRDMTTEMIVNADILLVRSVTKVDSGLLSPNRVRFVGTATIGVDHIDTEYLRDNNIGFASAPGSNADSVAEYIVAGLLELGKNPEGKSIGVVGVGNVGSKVAKKCEALGMKVCLNDPPLARQTKDAKYLSIEKIFDCDFVTMHTPLTFEGQDKTFHMADEKFFQSLKKGCVFFNTSRGEVVDSEALKGAIKGGRLGSVVLDVWEDEPNIDVELLEMVDIGTPHISGYSLDGKVTGMVMIYKAACEYFGIDVQYGIEDFLPEAAVPKLEVDSRSVDIEDVLRHTVKRIYDIKKDDSDLRWILEQPISKRGKYFSGLRKNYPVRREFGNTKVVTDNKIIAEKLNGIGFKL